MSEPKNPREIIARAVGSGPPYWTAADLIMDRLKDAGYAIVPVQPTEAATFIKLLQREVPFLRILIDTGTTECKRSPPILGIWKLDHNGFIRICQHIGRPIIQVAAACDEFGPGERFFRLNAEFARWLEEYDPEMIIEIDSIII